jgi:hypothetical protein
LVSAFVYLYNISPIKSTPDLGFIGSKQRGIQQSDMKWTVTIKAVRRPPTTAFEGKEVGTANHEL